MRFCEYIYTAGSSCIDLGMKCKSSLKIQIGLKMTSITGYAIIGAPKWISESDAFRLFNYSQVAYLDWGSGQNLNRIYGGSLLLNTRYNLEIGNRYVKNIDSGSYFCQGSVVGDFEKTYNLTLCGNNADCSGYFYYVRVYDGDTLLFDGIPAVNDNDEAGLYDNVTGVFFENTGSGAFTPGAIYTNYTTVEDIVASVENATKLVDNTKYDENSYTISGIPDYVKYKGASISTIYANGNSWIGFDAESEHFKFNRRDAAMYNLWTEEGTLLDIYRFFRVRWGGVCKYNAYGDPYFQTFDLIIFDTGDVMFYAVDIPTQYYDGVNSFADVEYNAPTTDSRYVTFYAQADGTYRIEYAPISFVSIVTKYLVRDGSTIYTVADGALAEVTGELSASLFTEYGVDTIPDGALLMTLATPEVLCWTDADTVPKLTATVTATPQSQVIITDKIYLTDKSITGIESALATCEGELIVAVSFDDKQTWKAWNGKQWATLSDDNTGMSKETLEGITFEQWNELYTGATGFYVRISLTDTTQAVEKIVFDFAN